LAPPPPRGGLLGGPTEAPEGGQQARTPRGGPPQRGGEGGLQADVAEALLRHGSHFGGAVAQEGAQSAETLGAELCAQSLQSQWILKHMLWYPAF